MVGAIIREEEGRYRVLLCAEMDSDPNRLNVRPVRSLTEKPSFAAAQDFIDNNGAGRGMGKSSAPSRG